MARSRLRIVSQLFFLVGLPVLVLTGLFGGGVYLGLEHRERVLVFERDVLRLDVTVPPASASPQPGAASKIVTAQRQPVGAEREDVTVPAQPSPQPPPQLVPPAKPDGAALPDVLVDPSGAVADPPPGATPPGVAPALPNSAPPATTPTEPSAVSAMPSAEGPSLGLPVRVSVKVLVDSELIEREADWIAYVQRLVSKASQIYATNFGVELALYGVSTWDVATRGMRAEALLDDLRTRPREGAHLLIGLTSRPYDADIAGQGDLPTAQSPINGAYAVVYATNAPWVAAPDDPVARGRPHLWGRRYRREPVGFGRTSELDECPARRRHPRAVDRSGEPKTHHHAQSLAICAAAEE